MDSCVIGAALFLPSPVEGMMGLGVPPNPVSEPMRAQCGSKWGVGIYRCLLPGAWWTWPIQTGHSNNIRQCLSVQPSVCVQLPTALSRTWLFCPHSLNPIPTEKRLLFTQPYQFLMTHTTDSSLEELGPAVLAGSLCEPFLAYNPLPAGFLIVTGWDLGSPDKWAGERSHPFKWSYI